MRILESAGQAESYIMHYGVNPPWPIDINVICVLCLPSLSQSLLIEPR